LSEKVERLTVELPAGFRPFEGPEGASWWDSADGTARPQPRAPGTFNADPAVPISFDTARGVFTDGTTDEGSLAQALLVGGFRKAEVARHDFLWIPILLVEGEFADGSLTRSVYVYTGTGLAVIILDYVPETPSSPRDDEVWATFKRSLITGSRPPLSAPEARAELEFLYRSLKSAHYDLFAHRSKADYDRLYAATRASIRGPLAYRDLLRTFVPFVAYGRVGHGHLDFPIAEYFQAAQAGEKILPFDLRVREGRVLVTRNFSPDPRLAPGAEILALDGVPIAQALARVARYLSAERPSFLHAQMELVFSRWLWLDGGSRESFTVEVAQPGAAPLRFQIPGAPIAAVEDARQTRTHAWQTRAVEILPGGIAYLRPGTLLDDSGTLRRSNGEGFRRFVDQAFGRFLESGATRLLLDLRNNPGGDAALGDVIVAWFATRPFRYTDRNMLKVSPEVRELFRPAPGVVPVDPNALWLRSFREMERRPDGERFNFPPPLNPPRPGPRFRGQVYVLINRHSDSMSTSLAAMIQDYGFGKILGEETADLPTSYSGVEQFRLPRTKLEVSYPKSYYVRPNGDERLRGVVPDVALDSPLEDDAGEIVLREALDLLRHAPGRSQGRGKK
jgi:hypothetical protein